MQYDQRTLRPRSAPNQHSTLFSRRSRIRPSPCSIERAYIYIDKRSHDDRSTRVIPKTPRSRALKLERFFHGKREHSRQSALRHHVWQKKRERCI